MALSPQKSEPGAREAPGFAGKSRRSTTLAGSSDLTFGGALCSSHPIPLNRGLPEPSRDRGKGQARPHPLTRERVRLGGLRDGAGVAEESCLHWESTLP